MGFWEEVYTDTRSWPPSDFRDSVMSCMKPPKLARAKRANQSHTFWQHGNPTYLWKRYYRFEREQSRPTVTSLAPMINVRYQCLVFHTKCHDYRPITKCIPTVLVGSLRLQFDSAMMIVLYRYYFLPPCCCERAGGCGMRLWSGDRPVTD